MKDYIEPFDSLDFIYLASPYSHPDPAVRLDRYHRVALVAGKLMQEGYTVFCPIAHSHQIGIALNKPTDHAFWVAQDMPFLRAASSIYVLILDGWKESVGVAYEIALAYEMDKGIVYIAEDGRGGDDPEFLEPCVWEED